MSLSTPGAVFEAVNPFWFIDRIESLVRDFYGIFMFTSLFISLIPVAMVYLSCFFQGLPCTWPSVSIPFLVTFSIYNLNRKTDDDEDRVNRKDRYTFTKRHGNSLLFLAILAFFAAIIQSILTNVPVLLVTSLPFFFGLLYSVRWLPRRFPYRRFKDIPVVKNLIISLSWSIPSALLPVFMNGNHVGVKTLITFLLFFDWAVTASVIPDVLDKEGDAMAGVKTIPVILGEDRTKNLLLGGKIVLGGMTALLSLQFMEWIQTEIIIVSIIYSVICIQIFYFTRMRTFICDVLSDGQFIIFTCLLLAFRTFHYPL